MRQLLRDTLSYLIIKRKQAEIILSFPNYKHIRYMGRTKFELDKQYKLWKELKQLNQGGVSKSTEEDGRKIKYWYEERGEPDPK